jgi:phage terminase large subunit-like protein
MAAVAIVSQLVALDRVTRHAVLSAMQPIDQLQLYAGLRYDWSIWARQQQQPPPEPWRYWIMTGGRGSGKTRPAAEQVIEWAKVPETRIALVGRDAGQGRKVMVDGESGIRPCSPPWFRPRYLPSLKRLVWDNGSIAELHSANEPDTLRGPQYHKAWLEELFHWKIPPRADPREPIAWSEGIRYCLRLGQNPQAVITSTPRSTEFCHNLLLGPKSEETGQRAVQALPVGAPNRYTADGFPFTWTHETQIEIDGIPNVVRSFVVRWPTEDNRDNLSPGKPEEWRREWGSSRLGQQELDGAILAHVLGALFTTDLIDRNAVDGVPRIIRTLVAVDPTRADSPVDEAGIIVGGLGEDGDAYIWDDCTVKGSPEKWAAAALEAKHKYGAEAIVYEKNQMPKSTQDLIRTKDRTVRWVEVYATENKQTRAEPVSALYEQRRVHHVRDAQAPDRLARLEDEMISWDPKLRMPSPNRLDALVWLVTALLLEKQHTPMRLL